GNTTEVSVDTRLAHRDTTSYQVIEQDGVELFLLPQLVQHTTSMAIDSKKFFCFRNLKAELELENGTVFGRRAPWA
ncbi:MAG: hypothetical protein VYA78_02795, partial [Chloroflexota bacterium]|nr:hypothetical protein [Chloroflexota bacterium]